RRQRPLHHAVDPQGLRGVDEGARRIDRQPVVRRRGPPAEHDRLLRRDQADDHAHHQAVRDGAGPRHPRQRHGTGRRQSEVPAAVVKTKFAEKLYEEGEEKVAAAYPAKRLGVPEDIAALAAFLLSDEASWITGELVVADGGVTLGGGA